jgi:hypothetical protein
MRDRRSPARTILALGGISLLACGSAPSGPPCRVRVERMEVALDMLAGNGHVGDLDGVELVDLPDGERLRRGGASIVVTAGGEVRFRGEPFGRDRVALGQRLERALHWDDDRPVLYVAADAETTLGAINEIMEVVPYFVEPRLVGNGGAPSLDIYQDRLRERPSVVRFRAEVDKAGGGERAVLYGKRLEQAIGTRCAPVKVVFEGSIALGADREQAVARDLPAALAKCDCGVSDPDLLEFLLYDIFGGWEQPQRWMPLKRQHGLADATVADLARG